MRKKYSRDIFILGNLWHKQDMMFRVSGLEGTKRDTSKLTKITGLFSNLFLFISFIKFKSIHIFKKFQFEIPKTAFTSLQKIEFS